jgi:hypothetical protein
MEPLAKSFPHDMATLDCRTFFCDNLAVNDQDAVWVDSPDWSLAGRLANNVLPIGFVRAPSLSHALMARSSSLRSGCVVYSPFLNRATCSMDVPFSTARLNPSIRYIRLHYRELFVSSFG